MSEIEELKKKLDEVIDTLNFVTLYYEGNGDYPGSIKKLKQEVKSNEWRKTTRYYRVVEVY